MKLGHTRFWTRGNKPGDKLTRKFWRCERIKVKAHKSFCVRLLPQLCFFPGVPDNQWIRRMESSQHVLSTIEARYPLHICHKSTFTICHNTSPDTKHNKQWKFLLRLHTNQFQNIWKLYSGFRIHIQHMNRGWYTSDLQVIITDFGHEINSVMGSWSITSQPQCCNMTSEWLIIWGLGLSCNLMMPWVSNLGLLR